MLVHRDFPLDLEELGRIGQLKTNPGMVRHKNALTRVVDLAVLVLQFHFETMQFSDKIETVDDTIENFVNPQYPQLPKEALKRVVEYIRDLLPINIDNLFYIHATKDASYIYFDTLENPP